MISFVSFSILLSLAQAASILTVPYASIERMISSGILTESGRYYLQGGPDEDCAYAFVQEPKVRASGRRLEVRFLFAGRAGTRIGERCVGAGDNFDVIVSGVPRYDDGEIYLDDLRFEADNVLFEAFSLLIERQLTPRLRLPFEKELASRIAAWSSVATGSVRLKNIEVESIRLGDEALELSASYEVALEP